MYDKEKIIPGLVIFFFLLTFPFWYNLGQASYEPPKPQLPTKEKECVESLEWMRANHMELLNAWRNEVVRKDYVYYKNEKGKVYLMSLQRTCMKCHTSREKFCERCHDKFGVRPYCWDCHIAPEEVSNGQ